MTFSQIRILIVDDHTMVRQAMKALFEEFEDIQVVGEAADGAKAIELVDRLKPDVVLIDLLMPIMDGIEAIKKIRIAHPDQCIIVLTASYSDEKLIQAVEAGAMSYFRKDTEVQELIQVIRQAYKGEPVIRSKMG